MKTMQKNSLKGLISFLLICLVINPLYSQPDTNKAQIDSIDVEVEVNVDVADTTKIKFGENKIIILDKDGKIVIKQKAFQNAITKLELGRIQLDTQKKALKGQMKGIEGQMKGVEGRMKGVEKNPSLSENQREKQLEELEEELEGLEVQLENLDKQIEALDEGIEDIDEEIEELAEEMENDEDFNFQFDWDEAMKEEDFNFDNDNPCGDNNNFKGFDGCFLSSKKFDGHWAGFSFGINNFANADMKMELPADGQFMELNTSKSWGFELNLIEYSLPIIPHHWGIVTGLGFEWNNYRFEKDITLVKNNDGVIEGVYSDPLVDYKKNTLNTTYLNVPLIMEFQLPVGDKKKPVYLGAGVIGGVKIGSKTKQKYNDKKDKVKEDYQIAPFRYAVTARVGYRALNLFANYSLQALFEKDKGPELYPFTIGLSIPF